MTSASDNFHKLMCTNDKFSLTGLALISLICWCERINKFSLTSLHCSQQYKYTADNKKSCCHPPLQDRSQKPLSMRDSFLPSMFENGGQQMLFRHVFQLLTRPFVDLFKF